MITGPSGAGKGTVVDALAERLPFHLSVSVTTRDPRPGEEEGVDYRFVERPEFERMEAAGEFLETALYNGELYGTPRAPVEEHLARREHVVLEIELNGARQVKSAYPEAVVIFVTAPSEAELRRRLRGRGDEEEDIRRRLEIARAQLDLTHLFDHVVVNDWVDRAVEEILRILSVEQRDPSP
ncbi:MAG: guanylate kinase [Acidimicrobiia bacterium]